MRATLILSALVAVAAAAPFAIRDTDAWAPLPGTSVKCSEDNKYMSLVIGPENADSILKHSCAAFMPTCAYPTENKIDPSTACADVVTYPIDGPNNITLPVLVEQDGNKLSGWAVNCKYPVNAMSSKSFSSPIGMHLRSTYNFHDQNY
jgi:hypothetical protein